jgi:hypothetical protein
MHPLFATLTLVTFVALALLLLVVKDRGWQFSLRLLLVAMTLTGLALTFFIAANSRH